ncbi:MAG: hypothetical protein PHF60_01855 [Candidatus ainarchaeum sp.]|nr:hypothetical protein [Candidatus ainarchaeum sp.]
MKILDAALIVAIAAIVLIFAFFMMNPAPKPTGDYTAFAKCLTENGAKMYGSELCTHCEDQKESFGDSWQYVTYVECHAPMGGQNQACIDAGITAYPTWEFKDKTRHVGFMEFQELSQASGCPLNATG